MQNQERVGRVEVKGGDVNNESNIDYIKFEALLEQLVSYMRKTVSNHRTGSQGRGRGLQRWIMDQEIFSLLAVNKTQQEIRFSVECVLDRENKKHFYNWVIIDQDNICRD